MTSTRKKIRPQPKPPTPLKAARLLRGYDLEQVAGWVGASVASLGRYEAGAFPRDLAVAKRLVELYETPLEDLWPALKDDEAA